MKIYKLIVETCFVDKDDNSIEYKVGTELLISDLERVNDLISRKLARLEDAIFENSNPISDKNKKSKKQDKKLEELKDDSSENGEELKDDSSENGEE